MFTKPRSGQLYKDVLSHNAKAEVFSSCTPSVNNV